MDPDDTSLARLDIDAVFSLRFSHFKTELARSIHSSAKVNRSTFLATTERGQEVRITYTWHEKPDGTLVIDEPLNIKCNLLVLPKPGGGDGESLRFAVLHRLATSLLLQRGIAGMLKDVDADHGRIPDDDYLQ